MVSTDFEQNVIVSIELTCLETVFVCFNFIHVDYSPVLETGLLTV